MILTTLASRIAGEGIILLDIPPPWYVGRSVICATGKTTKQEAVCGVVVRYRFVTGCHLEE